MESLLTNIPYLNCLIILKWKPDLLIGAEDGHFYYLDNE